MGFLIFFWTLMAEALLIMSVLEFDIEAELSPALTRILKKIGHGPTWSPNSLAGITAKILVGLYPKHSSKDNKELFNWDGRITDDNNDLRKGLELGQALAPGGPIQYSFSPKSNRHCFPRAPISKGYNCPTHKGDAMGCTAFLEHQDYEYKLLCHGEFYFRPKDTHTFRTSPIVSKEPDRLFVVKLNYTGSNVVIFCFEPNSQALGEVNDYDEFLLAQTSIASSQEAHGL